MNLKGELTFFMGLQVRQSKKDIFIHQEKYAKDLINKFRLENCKRTETLMSSSLKLEKDEGGKKVDQKLYRSMIGSSFPHCLKT